MWVGALVDTCGGEGKGRALFLCSTHQAEYIQEHERHDDGTVYPIHLIRRHDCYRCADHHSEVPCDCWDHGKRVVECAKSQLELWPFAMVNVVSVAEENVVTDHGEADKQRKKDHHIQDECSIGFLTIVPSRAFIVEHDQGPGTQSQDIPEE